MRIKAAGLCHSDLSVINGDRPRPVPMALGHEAAGDRRGGRVRRRRPCPRRPRGLRLRALLRPLRAVRGGPAGLVRAGGGGQRCGHAAVRGAPPAPAGRHAGPPSFGGFGLRRIRRRLAALAGQGRPGAAARGGRTLRLCRAHRRRGGGQHRPHARRQLGGGDRARRRWPVLAPGCGRRGCPRGRRHRPRRRQARLRPPARCHRHLQRQGPGLRRAGQERHRRRARVRLRARRLGPSAGARLPDHPPRRHHGDRGPAAADGDHGPAGGPARGRGADAQGQLHRHRGAVARHPALHSALPSAAGCRSTG